MQSRVEPTNIGQGEQRVNALILREGVGDDGGEVGGGRLIS